MFVVYLVACLGSFAIPSAVGENVLRLRYAAIPIAVLTLSLRRWRPLPVALGVLALAITWNVTPISSSTCTGAATRPPRVPTGRRRSATCART